MVMIGLGAFWTPFSLTMGRPTGAITPPIITNIRSHAGSRTVVSKQGIKDKKTPKKRKYKDNRQRNSKNIYRKTDTKSIQKQNKKRKRPRR